MGDEWCEAAAQLHFLDFAGWAISESTDENGVIGRPSIDYFSPEMWVRPCTGGGAKSTLMERRLVVLLLADRIGPREDAVVYRARLSNQTGPLELGLWNKSNDFTHVRLRNWGALSL
jgi:hypothetical protein